MRRCLAGDWLMPAAHEVVAPVSAWSTPLSFWGGVEPTDGRIIDRSHPGVGHCVGGTILCLPGGRGSSSASSVFAEAIRLGTAPKALVLAEADPMLLTGALVAEALYGLVCPIAVVPTLGEHLSAIQGVEGVLKTVTEEGRGMAFIVESTPSSTA